MSVKSELASRRRRGDAFEVKVVKDQERFGRRAARLRQAEVWDVMSFEECQDALCTLYGRMSHMYLIVCRIRPSLSTQREQWLVEDARRMRAIPLLAWKDGNWVEYRRLG